MSEVKMHVGVQGIGTSKTELEFLRRHGVTHMDATVEGNDTDCLLYTSPSPRDRG